MASDWSCDLRDVFFCPTLDFKTESKDKWSLKTSSVGILLIHKQILQTGFWTIDSKRFIGYRLEETTTGPQLFLLF